jgi:hypothetical protein
LVFGFVVIALLSYILFFVFIFLYDATYPLAQCVAHNEDKQISPLYSFISHQESTIGPAFMYLLYAYIHNVVVLTVCLYCFRSLSGYSCL